jgi:hypothetical protein
LLSLHCEPELFRVSQNFPEAHDPSAPQWHSAVTAALPSWALHSGRAAQHGLFSKLDSVLSPSMTAEHKVDLALVSATCHKSWKQTVPTLHKI